MLKCGIIKYFIVLPRMSNIRVPATMYECMNHPFGCESTSSRVDCSDDFAMIKIASG